MLHFPMAYEKLHIVTAAIWNAYAQMKARPQFCHLFPDLAQAALLKNKGRFPFTINPASTAANIRVHMQNTSMGTQTCVALHTKLPVNTSALIKKDIKATIRKVISSAITKYRAFSTGFSLLLKFSIPPLYHNLEICNLLFRNEVNKNEKLSFSFLYSPYLKKVFINVLSKFLITDILFRDFQKRFIEVHISLFYVFYKDLVDKMYL